MKKTAILIITGFLLITASLAALDMPAEYSVDSFKGTVKYQNDQGRWVSITKDTVLTDESVINTGLNSTLVLLTTDEEKLTIGAMKRGILGELLVELTQAGGISFGGSLAGKDLDTETGKDRTNISTASTRASESKDDLEWEEEEEE